MQRRRVPPIRSLWRWVIALSIVLVAGCAVAGFYLYHSQTEVNHLQTEVNGIQQTVGLLYAETIKLAQPGQLSPTTTTTTTSPPSTTTTTTTTVPVATAPSPPAPPSPTPPVAFTGTNIWLMVSAGALLILAGLVLRRRFVDRSGRRRKSLPQLRRNAIRTGDRELVAGQMGDRSVSDVGRRLTHGRVRVAGLAFTTVTGRAVRWPCGIRQTSRRNGYQLTIDLHALASITEKHGVRQRGGPFAGVRTPQGFVHDATGKLDVRR